MLLNVLMVVTTIVTPVAKSAPGHDPGSTSIVRVSAAASLREVLDDIANEFQKQTNTRVEVNFGASGQLAEQIRNGAPVDLFIAAAERDLDGVDDPATRTTVAENTLVLITPANAKWEGGFETLERVHVKKIAMGQPKSVPAGEYAKRALDRLGIFDFLRDKIIYGAHVRQVLDYVSRGEVDAGFVYATDALQAGDQVKVVARASEELTGPIRYVAAVAKHSRNIDGARKFLDFVQSAPARELFTKRGFVIPRSTTAPAR
jgi:molybdate transport system substrate-binding protein